jgi:hypothetical protein
MTYLLFIISFKYNHIFTMVNGDRHNILTFLLRRSIPMMKRQMIMIRKC